MNGMTVEYESGLSGEEIRDKLRETCRPWSRIDLWTGRNNWFWRERADKLWLVRTGPAMGYVRAVITVTPTEHGSRLAAVLEVPRSHMVGCCVVALVIALRCGAYLIFGKWLECVLDLLRFGWVPVVYLYFLRRLRNTLSELPEFMEKNLLK